MTRLTTGTFDELDADEPFAGVRRRVLDTDRATVTRYEFEPGAAFPLHRHLQEQITIVEEGHLEMTLDGVVSELGRGSFSVVGPEIEHGIRAGDGGATVLAIVIPPRASPDAFTVTGEAA